MEICGWLVRKTTLTNYEQVSPSRRTNPIKLAAFIQLKLFEEEHPLGQRVRLPLSALSCEVVTANIGAATTWCLNRIPIANTYRLFPKTLEELNL
jgi:hypothetical protein